MVGIPPLTPLKLAPQYQSLPTILYTHCQNPMPSYSKAPRGLSVLLQVIGIFTDITTSPGLQPRQLPNHFTIRAGRNLPDKEFRYLRTGVSPYTSPFSLAQTCVFGKQLLGTLHCDLFLLKVFILSHNIGTPSPEVTGPFCRVPQLELSCRPRVTHPVHLCRFTVRALHNLNRSFSRQYRICDLQPKLLTHKISCLNMWICLHVHTTSLERDNRRPSHIPSCVTPSLITFIQWYRNINLFSIRLRF